MTKHYTPAEVEALLARAEINEQTAFQLIELQSEIVKAFPTIARQFVEQAKEIERIKAAAHLPYMQNGTEPDGWVLVRQDRIIALDEAIGSDR